MKKLLTSMSVTFVIIFCAAQLSAQGVYFNVNVGYGLKTSTKNLSDFINSKQETLTSYTDKQINVSLGKGFDAGLTAGYLFNKNIGAELGLSFLVGGKTTATSENSFANETTTQTIAGSMFRINPCFVVTAGLDKVNPYAKFGLVVGIGSVKTTYKDENSGDVAYMKTKFSGGVAVGFSAAAGAIYNINDRFSVFGELNMVNLSYAPSKSLVKEATHNGTDVMSYMTTSEKETDYVNSITHDGTTPSSADPSKELKNKLPFGSFGISVGFRMSLGGK